MSFAMTVKDDLLKVNSSEKNENLAMLESLLRFGGEVIISRPIRLSFTCNNMAVVRHVIKLAKMYYEIDFEIESRTVKRFDNHTVFTCVITKGADEIIKDLSLFGKIPPEIRPLSFPTVCLPCRPGISSLSTKEFTWNPKGS